MLLTDLELDFQNIFSGLCPFASQIKRKPSGGMILLSSRYKHNRMFVILFFDIPHR